MQALRDRVGTRSRFLFGTSVGFRFQMRRTIALLRNEPKARVFFAVLTQSSLGTGAAYVALLLVAYDRFRSAWAVSLVLLADLVAPMILGPVFGAAGDRWSRRKCAIAGDLMRLFAFVGIPLVSGFELTLLLAVVAGAGTALFKPATLAALPSLVEAKRLSAATSLYGAIDDLGLAAGPALAALGLVFFGPETILVVNAGTFAVSAMALALLDFGRAPQRPEGLATSALLGLFGEARDGLKAIARFAGLWALLGASAAALFFAGLVNVAELPFITGDLDAGDSVYSATVALAGAGIVMGSLAGGAGGTLAVLRRRYLIGLGVMGMGALLSGLAPSWQIILVTFALGGFGNGLMLIHERLIIQATVPDHLTARVFGVKDALSAWSFGLAFVAAGALISAFDTRPVLILAGVGTVAVGGVAILTLRIADSVAVGAPAAGEPGPRSAEL